MECISLCFFEDRLVLRQNRSIIRKDEIEAVMALLGTLDLNGSTVALDTTSYQKKVAEKIKARGGDYMISLKDHLSKEVMTYFNKVSEDSLEKIQTCGSEIIDTGWGNIEIRRYHQLPITDCVGEAREWQGAMSVVEAIRERHIGETHTREVKYYLSSSTVNPQQAARIIQSHWGEEDPVHWVLEVVFQRS